ncbi:helix-turn-helix domain-containing protein [Salana multivorans]
MDTSSLTYLSIPQAAETVGCSSDTIRRMISRGQLKAVRFGRLIRIDPAALERAGKPVTRIGSL